MMTNTQFAFILTYRLLLISALLYVVGYLEWSGWWLLLLLTSPVVED